MKIQLNHQEVMQILLHHFMAQGHDVSNITVQAYSSGPVFNVYSEGIVRPPLVMMSRSKWSSIEKKLKEIESKDKGKKWVTKQN